MSVHGRVHVFPDACATSKIFNCVRVQNRMTLKYGTQHGGVQSDQWLSTGVRSGGDGKRALPINTASGRGLAGTRKSSGLICCSLGHSIMERRGRAVPAAGVEIV